MTVELKHVVIDDVAGRSIVELREIATDCDVLKGAVQAEIKRQLDEAMEALKATGVAVPATPGPKAKTPEEKAAAKAAKAAKKLEIDVALDDAEPATLSGNA